MSKHQSKQKAKLIEELVQKLANATKTYYGCFGHNKANMNKSNMDEYVRQLKKLKHNIPSDNELLDMGVFNGEGAY